MALPESQTPFLPINKLTELVQSTTKPNLTTADYSTNPLQIHSIAAYRTSTQAQISSQCLKSEKSEKFVLQVSHRDRDDSVEEVS